MASQTRLTKISQLTTILRNQLLLASENFCESDKQQRLELIQNDLVMFAKIYLGHHIRDAEKVGTSEFHQYLSVSWCELVRARKLTRSAIAAPRGEAKSTYLLALVLWSILTREKHFVVYIMDTLAQAENMLGAIKEEIILNPRIRQDFPAINLISSTKEKLVLSIKGGANCCVVAKGSKQRLRGLKFGAQRPDLILLDDIENDQNVILKEQRDKLQSWLERAVYNLGEAGANTTILLVGTVLHEDSLLSRLLKNPLWIRRRFSAIKTMPHRSDLWDTWESILKQQSEKDALLFYTKHQEEMEKGASLNWPKKRSLLELMTLRAAIGRESFNAEQQNAPSDHTQNFHKLIYWEKPDPDWTIIGAVDPSLGKAGGDPCAILIGGISQTNACIDIILADIAHLPPDQIIEKIISYQQSHHVVNWYFENIQFQEFLRHELVARASKLGVPLSATPVSPSAPKNVRIDALRAPVADGRLRFHKEQTTLIEQLKAWPKGVHDDGPDALAMLWKFGLPNILNALAPPSSDLNEQTLHHSVSSRHSFMDKNLEDDNDQLKENVPW